MMNAIEGTKSIIAAAGRCMDACVVSYGSQPGDDDINFDGAKAKRASATENSIIALELNIQVSRV